MNHKYRKPSMAATMGNQIKIPASLANVAAMVVIVISLVQTASIMSAMSSAGFNPGACVPTLAVAAGQNPVLGQCQK
jgi:hypothetical protein